MADSLPNPQRIVHLEFGRLPKVFVVYPHNPNLYEQIQPPGVADIARLKAADSTLTDELIWQRFERECVEQERTRDQTIAAHKREVCEFVRFLEKSCIAVSYDRLLEDTGSANQMRWCQQQITDSDYVILIVTPSFCPLLDDEAPDEEFLFVGDYLYNLIHNKPDSLKGFLPIFLNRTKDLSLLPKAREANTVYEVWKPYDVTTGERADDLMSLYRLLTKQPAFEQPPLQQQSVVKVLAPRRRRFGAGIVDPGALKPEQKRAYERLSGVKQPLSDIAILTLSQNKQFSQEWKQLAAKLGLTASQIERYGERGDISEVCYQMLMEWRNSQQAEATVAALSNAILQSKNYPLLVILNAAV